MAAARGGLWTRQDGGHLSGHPGVGPGALDAFADVPGIEPTNNAAERALRPAVLWRKGCFGTHSAAGSRFVERMLTVAATLRQQQRNVVDYVTTACVAALHGHSAPSLLLLPTPAIKLARA